MASRPSSTYIIKKTLPYLWGGSLEIRVRVILAMAALVLSKLFTVLTPIAYKYTVDAVAPEEASPSFWLGFGAITLLLIYGLTRIMGVGFTQLRDFLFSKVAQRALRRLALETFVHIHALSLRFHLTRKTGAMMRIVSRGVHGLEFLLRFVLFSIVPLILELGFVAILLYVMLDGRYLLITVAMIGLYCWFTFALTEKRVRIRKVMNEADQKANQRALDSLLNYETVKYFSAEGREAERYDIAMEGYERAAISTTNTLAGLNFGQSLILSGGMVAIMLLALVEIQAGRASIGDFVMVNAYMIQIAMPLNFLGTVYREIRQSLVDMGEMFELLEEAPEIQDAADARPLEVREGEIVFDRVSFSYDRERQILGELSLTLGAGKTIAVVGPSGSGKSTLARLLYRFYDPQGGDIRIDGQSLRAVTQASLRDHIGIVPQDTVLFNESIGYNIAYGRPDASEEEVIAAAKAAQIHDFVTRLPKGYDTQVGERGLKLSGGEKQRVGIARTLLKNPPILVLDEATSALDSETEQGILGSLHEMSRGRTVLTVAHRLSTIIHADEIVVLEDGRIAERGTHAELIARNGRYAHMWAQQQAEEQAAE